MYMRLKANSVYRSSSRDEVPEKLLEQTKPVLFIQNDPVVIHKHQSVRVERGHQLVNLQPDIWVPALVLVEGVADCALVDHLVDDVPVLHSEGMEMIQSVLNVLEDS